MASYDARMFVLAHLSDPHLGPLPRPRFAELMGKRATGFLNWRRKRGLIHRADVLARIVADLKAQAADHIAVTGDLVDPHPLHGYAVPAGGLSGRDRRRAGLRRRHPHRQFLTRPPRSLRAGQPL